MLFNDTYQTISKPSEGIFRDRGSKFIAHAYPVKQESDIKEIINLLKAENPKARHHCWALRLSPDRSVFKLNDDGEPSGTAGRPILNTLLSYDVTNILVVVIRYFGGTLLGIPGLINAYKNATIEALNAAEIVTQTICDYYRLEFDYLHMNELMKLFKDENLSILNPIYDNNCSLETAIKKSDVNRIINRIENLQGTVKLHYLTTA